MTVLEEILAKGEVEPELLAELSDEQKIVLFYKIRQEQIKRWDVAYKEVSDGDKANNKIAFLKGNDGNEWVWVMGDSPGDETFDQVWMKYAIINAENELKQSQPQLMPLAEFPIAETIEELQVNSEKNSNEPTEHDDLTANSLEDTLSENLPEKPSVETEDTPETELNSVIPEFVENETANSELTNSSTNISEHTVSTQDQKQENYQSESYEASIEDEVEAKFPIDPLVATSTTHSDSDGESQPFPVAPKVEAAQPEPESARPPSIADRLKFFNTGSNTNVRQPVITQNSLPRRLPSDPNFYMKSVREREQIEEVSRFPTPNANSGSVQPIEPPSFKPTYSPTVARPQYLDQFSGGKGTIGQGQPTLQQIDALRQSQMALMMGSNNNIGSNNSLNSAGVHKIKTNPFASRPPNITPSMGTGPRPGQGGGGGGGAPTPASIAQLSASSQASVDLAFPSPSAPTRQGDITPVNLDASVNQLIEKQNAFVKQYLRQSIIHDETEALSLQADWEERERKAKERETQMKEANQRFREIARKVIQEQLPVPLSRAFCMSASGSNVPQSRQEVVRWFQTQELDRKAGCDPDSGAICLWFHGIITREQTEQLLWHASVGSFLIRVSEKIFGYTLSYRAHNRCKHFLIDPSEDAYQFYGLNMKRHKCLYDLVMYHTSKPVSASGNELLIYPIGQKGQSLDYAELFQRNNFVQQPTYANTAVLPPRPYPRKTPNLNQNSFSLSTQF